MNGIVGFVCATVLACAAGAYIEKNAYRGVSILFARGVRQEQFNFEKLKEVLRKSSELLLHSTRKRARFAEFILSLPSSWKQDLCESTAVKPPGKVDIYVTASESEDLRAQHSEGCSRKGDLIYMPLAWLRGETNELARQFVQEWAIFRYGVFEENPLDPGSCFYGNDNSLAPTGCYNVDLKQETLDMSETGMPVCYVQEGFYSRDDLSSSIMFTANATKALSFCDGSAEFPHNPVMPTRHNALCRGKPTWAVILESDDFKYGRNPPVKASPPAETTFRCFQEPPMQLTLAVQNSSTQDISKIVEEVRYSLLRFLLYDAPKTDSARVNLLTFSDESSADVSTSHSVDFANLKNLQPQLKAVIRTVGRVGKVCLSCGLRKALKVSRSGLHPSPTVVLIALASSAITELTSDLVRDVTSFTDERLYLVFIQDVVDDDVIPPELLAAVCKTGGQVFIVPADAVLMRSRMNVALLSSVQSAQHLEQSVIVVHEATYADVHSDVTDTFATDRGLIGRMVYTVQCNDTSLQPLEATCTALGIDNPYICVDVVDLAAESEDDAARTWTHTYQYLGGIYPITCSMLATVQLSENSSYPLTLRGWLNHYTIKPGRDNLVMYAEVIQILNVDFRVTAKVYGPGMANDPPETLDLIDNGNGDPDVKKGDNIYSRYYTRFRQKGTYFVILHLHAAENSFSRTAVIGSFSVLEQSPALDIYPPNRIGDLRVNLLDTENRTVTLSWTAPGDDYDYGAATKYTVKYSMHWTALMLDISFNTPEIQCLQNAEGEDIVPASSGSAEIRTFQMPGNDEDAVYFIALLAIDKVGNKGQVSNIVQVYTSSTEPLVTENEVKSTETTVNVSLISSTMDDNDTSDKNQTSEWVETTFSVSDSTVTTSTPTDSANMSGSCLDKHLVILVSASAGTAFVVIVLVVNIIVCCCCFKKRNKEPKNLSRKASLRPPYNLNIAYRKEEPEANHLEAEEDPVNSSVESNIYTSPQRIAPRDNSEYEDHVRNSLRASARQDVFRRSGPRIERNGFEVVTAMPAYATTSLSHYAHDGSIDSAQLKPRVAQMQQSVHVRNGDNDSHVYPLGLV